MIFAVDFGCTLLGRSYFFGCVHGDSLLIVVEHTFPGHFQFLVLPDLGLKESGPILLQVEVSVRSVSLS